MEKRDVGKSFVKDINFLDNCLNILNSFGSACFFVFILLSVSLTNIIVAYLMKDISLKLTTFIANATVFFWKGMGIFIAVFFILAITKTILCGIERKRIRKIRGREYLGNIVNEELKKLGDKNARRNRNPTTRKSR